MSVINKLASSLRRRDEVPNQQLAKQIAEKSDTKAVKELVDNLHNKSRDIQNDCIKVLYETGERKPALIAGYVKEFIQLLDSKNNRLQWGAMTALNTITSEIPQQIYTALPKIMEAAEKGSVITRDNGVYILIKLCSVKKYTEKVFPLLIELLLNSPVNQLPLYAEKAVPVIDEKNKGLFIKTLRARLTDIEKETKRKRVEKIIQRFSTNN